MATFVETEAPNPVNGFLAAARVVGPAARGAGPAGGGGLVPVVGVIRAVAIGARPGGDLYPAVPAGFVPAVPLPVLPVTTALGVAAGAVGATLLGRGSGMITVSQSGSGRATASTDPERLVGLPSTARDLASVTGAVASVAGAVSTARDLASVAGAVASVTGAVASVACAVNRGSRETRSSCTAALALELVTTAVIFGLGLAGEDASASGGLG